MAKRKFSRKQLAAQRLFAKRARAGTLRKGRGKRAKGRKKGNLCFTTVQKVAKYMRTHGYRVVKK